MRIKKSLLKPAVFCIAVTMAIVSIPVNAVDLNSSRAELVESNVYSLNENENQDAELFIVEEDTSKRNQFEKHYLCSDGTYMAVTYPEAVHYLDENNIWQDVDNTLTYCQPAFGLYRLVDRHGRNGDILC